MIKLLRYAEIFSGYSFRNPLDNNEEGAFSVINLKDVSNNGPYINYTKLSTSTEFNGGAKYLLQEGDVLISARGNKNFALLFERNKCVKQTVPAGGFIIVRPMLEFLDAAYVAWYINLPESQGYFRQGQVGTTAQSLPIDTLKEFHIKVPQLFKQELIGKIYLSNQEEIQASRQREQKRTTLLNEQIRRIL